MLLLDTHVLIWLTERTQRISPQVEQQIDQSAREDGVTISSITFWEAGLLHFGGRVRLQQPIDGWLERVLAMPGLDVAPLTPRIALESTRLPGDIHRDPADRFLVATARELGATLVTHDRAILRYGEQGHVRVLAA